MACSITITEVLGIPPSPGASIVDSIIVKGTAQECSGINVGAGSLHLQITVTCMAGNENSANVTVVNGLYEGEIKLNCECGQPVKVEVVCLTDPTCTAPPFDGPLPCNVQGECPDIDVTMQIGDCDESGLRQVTFTTHVSAVGTTTPVVVEYDYGDGATGSGFIISGPGDIVEPAHGYSPGGSFVAALNIIHPSTCQAVQIPVDLTDQPSCNIECPVINQVNVSVGGCNSDGTRTVSFTAVISGGQATQYHWEFGTPGGEELTIPVTGPTVTPSTSHDYPVAGTGSTTYTAVLTVVAAGGQCIDAFPVVVTIGSCDGAVCPTLDDISANMGACISDTHRRVGLEASITGGGFTDYDWDFGDGQTQSIDPSVQGNPNTPHDYEIGNTYTATLAATAPTGCEDQSASETFTVSDCTSIRTCGSFLFLIVALMVLAISATLFTLALTTCPALSAIPVPTWLWYVVAGLWVATAAAIATWYFLCWLGICDCPTKCDWMVLAWIAAFTSGIIMLFLFTCCLIIWLWAGLGLLALASTLFGVWVYKCDPTLCYVLDLLSITFVTIAATALSYIVIVPAIQACAYTPVEVGVATIGAIIVAATAACHASE